MSAAIEKEGDNTLSVKNTLTMKNIKDLRIFIEICRLGSLSACAREMDLSRAVVSASLKRLESELDTILLVRSTRKLRITSRGKHFLEKCRSAVELLDEAYANIHQEDPDFSGTIRLSAPSDLGRNILLPWLDEFLVSHPKLDVVLELSDSLADLYGYPVDLALRYGEPRDSSLIAIPISTRNRILLCASPDYIRIHGAPRSPDQLQHHNCLCQGLNETIHDKWPLDGHPLALAVSGDRRCKDGDVTRRWAVESRGIALKAFLDVAPDLLSGRLVEIDVGWGNPEFPLYLLCAERRLLSPMVQAMAKHFKERASSLLQMVE